MTAKTFLVKLAGPESVILERVEADHFHAMDGLVTFRKDGDIQLVIGSGNLISFRPEVDDAR